MDNSIKKIKKLGQNFLQDQQALQQVVEFARVDGKNVLEIGAGSGFLTNLLSEQCRRVLALEVDQRFIRLLQKDFAGNEKVDILAGSILRLNLEELSMRFGSLEVVGNLPYYLTSKIILYLIDNRDYFASATIMVQDEVARRLASPPGNKSYGRLSILVQLFFGLQTGPTFPPSYFSPPPRVNSTLVRMIPYSQMPVEIVDINFFQKVVKAAFSQRRKKLLNNLLACPLFTLNRQELLSLLEESDIGENQRAEELTIAEFARLTEKLTAFNCV